MSSGPWKKRGVCLGFSGLALCFACSGSSGSHGAGGAASEDGGAPSEEDAGSQAGANNGKAGSTSSCDVGECFVANTCLDRCGGTVVYTGCCECVPPAVNQHSCASGN